VVFSLDSDPKSVRKTSSGACNKRQKHRRNPIIVAREWKEGIETGEYASQADLARKKGISKSRTILNPSSVLDSLTVSHV